MKRGLRYGYHCLVLFWLLALLCQEAYGESNVVSAYGSAITASPPPQDCLSAKLAAVADLLTVIGNRCAPNLHFRIDSARLVAFEATRGSYLPTNGCSPHPNTTGALTAAVQAEVVCLSSCDPNAFSFDPTCLPPPEHPRIYRMVTNRVSTILPMSDSRSPFSINYWRTLPSNNVPDPLSDPAYLFCMGALPQTLSGTDANGDLVTISRFSQFCPAGQSQATPPCCFREGCGGGGVCEVIPTPSPPPPLPLTGGGMASCPIPVTSQMVAATAGVPLAVVTHWLSLLGPGAEASVTSSIYVAETSSRLAVACPALRRLQTRLELVRPQTPGTRNAIIEVAAAYLAMGCATYLGP